MDMQLTVKPHLSGHDINGHLQFRFDHQSAYAQNHFIVTVLQFYIDSLVQDYSDSSPSAM